MNRPALMRLALGVGVLMVVILALTGCGGGSAQEEAKARPQTDEAVRYDAQGAGYIPSDLVVTAELMTAA